VGASDSQEPRLLSRNNSAAARISRVAQRIDLREGIHVNSAGTVTRMWSQRSQLAALSDIRSRTTAISIVGRVVSLQPSRQPASIPHSFRRPSDANTYTWRVYLLTEIPYLIRLLAICPVISASQRPVVDHSLPSSYYLILRLCNSSTSDTPRCHPRRLCGKGPVVHVRQHPTQPPSQHHPDNKNLRRPPPKHPRPTQQHTTWPQQPPKCRSRTAAPPA